MRTVATLFNYSGLMPETERQASEWLNIVRTYVQHATIAVGGNLLVTSATSDLYDFSPSDNERIKVLYNQFIDIANQKSPISVRIEDDPADMSIILWGSVQEALVRSNAEPGINSARGALELVYQHKIFEYDIPAPIAKFCEQTNILKDLRLSLSLIKKFFVSIVNLEMEIERDPQEETEWVSINFTVRGALDDISSSYDKYIEQWSNAADDNAFGLIRLAFSVE